MRSAIDFLGKNAAKPLCLVALGLAALTLWGLQVVRSGWCNDEAAHIPAGLYHLETGRMDAYRVNPPLPRMIAAIPLLLDRPDVDWHYSESRYVRNEYQFAHQWVRDNHENLRRYLILTRCTMAGFFVLGLWVVRKWASRLYGGPAGWLAAVLWILNPDIIANSAVVAPDLPATASGLLAGYVFWSWLIQRKRPFPWSVAAAVAFAVLCKFSWLFLLVGLPLVTLVHDALCKRESSGEGPRWLGGVSIARRVAVAVIDSLRLFLSFSLTVLLINWCYGFDGTGTMPPATRAGRQLRQENHRIPSPRTIV
jgi:4-amino-4-deoxy-L-arabinose transferase-like glycosyltransferase